eukprot:4513971-Pleurochrysis_carterae.AAC.2
MERRSRQVKRRSMLSSVRPTWTGDMPCDAELVATCGCARRRRARAPPYCDATQGDACRSRRAAAGRAALYGG